MDPHTSIERLIQFAYQRLKPKHFKVEDYGYTILFRLAAGSRCLESVIGTLEHSVLLGEQEVQIRLIKESESLLFHLAGAFEAFGQLLNLVLRFEMPEASSKLRGKSVTGVSFKKVSAALGGSKFRSSQLALVINESAFTALVSDLFGARDQVTHRKLLDYSAVQGASGWKPYVNVNDTSMPLVPYLRDMLERTNSHLEKALTATVSSVTGG